MSEENANENVLGIGFDDKVDNSGGGVVSGFYVFIYYNLINFILFPSLSSPLSYHLYTMLFVLPYLSHKGLIIKVMRAPSDKES